MAVAPVPMKRRKRTRTSQQSEDSFAPSVMKHRYSLITLFLLSLSVHTPLLADETPPSLATPITATDPENADAQFQLARAYLHGNGVPKDPKKSFDLMNAAAAKGHADATGSVGYFYSVGLGVPKNEKQATDWFRKGAEMGSAKAQFNYGKSLLDDKSGATKSPEVLQTEGIEWVKKAADQGLPEAALFYGMALYFGDHGQAQDYKKSEPYLKIAAETGNADAQNAIGVLYDSALVGTMDRVLAEQWYRKAAHQGHLKAQANLGRVLNPEGDNRESRIEALAWLLIASDQNEITAIKTLQNAKPGLKAGEMDAARLRSAALLKEVKK